MEIILQQGLPHQQKAVEAVCSALAGVEMTPPTLYYENPHVDLSSTQLYSNLQDLQKSIPAEYRNDAPVGDCLHLDIKMETGTGKTYVYTKTIFELHKQYGINKFIIAVPSLAIKAGTAQFIQDEYVRRHFADTCGYDAEIELGVLETISKKKGRSYFPSVVREFVCGSYQNSHKIYVLLVNMQLLAVRKNGMLSQEYDYEVAGFYRPMDAIRATKPVVIIDEPHRFSRDQKAFKVITEEIKPPCIIRYGATFPEVELGKGRNKSKSRDYINLLYDLNACAAFNEGLIKGVAKEHLDSPSGYDEKLKILAIKSKERVTIQRKSRYEKPKSFELSVEDSLAIAHKEFSGITIKAITKDKVEFSNGVIKSAGEEMAADVYMTSYQEEMLRLAIQRHFETERENFRREVKIKTLALFFIDDITSYRPDSDGKSPYLRVTFERLLRERIIKTLEQLDEHEKEYRIYLETSLSNLSACHAGYFARDNNDSDEEIANQVDIILRKKKLLISFCKEDGSYNTLRFLFSKWTLKEGWDNPNVFTIAKLRSSGSENSKLQEVGRGLRLPVDEKGNRVNNETFQLNYIVDFTEEDFAQRLVDQINSEMPQSEEITESQLIKIAEKRGTTADDLYDELYSKKYIDRHKNIQPDRRNQLIKEYPEFTFSAGVASDKIKDRNIDKSTDKIKIRKKAYQELRDLWTKLSQRYLLIYDSDLDQDMEKVVLTLLEKGNVFTDVSIKSSREMVQNCEGKLTTTADSGVQYIIVNPIPYGTFLKRISRSTNLPLYVLHNAIKKYAATYGDIKPEHINENSASVFCSKFQAWKTEHLMNRIQYKKCGKSRATLLADEQGTPNEFILQKYVGRKIAPGTPSEKYLYDAWAYDSDLELENIKAVVDEVAVYGKIPSCSVAIPTTTGGTYSPDFMYVLKKTTGEKVLNIIVETKGVENKSQLRDEEKTKIKCATIFFDTLKKEGYRVHFVEQLNNRQMAQIINDVLRVDSE